MDRVQSGMKKTANLTSAESGGGSCFFGSDGSGVLCNILQLLGFMTIVTLESFSSQEFLPGAAEAISLVSPLFCIRGTVYDPKTGRDHPASNAAGLMKL